MALFRDAVARTKGKDGVSPLSPNTVRSMLRHIQGVIDLAAPPGRHNRDGAGLIDHYPYARPPRARWTPPRFVPPEHFAACYQAAGSMTRPRGQGFSAGDWWRALLVFVWNTQLRRSTLLRLPMHAVDWDRRTLRVDPHVLKSGRGELRYLADVVLNHLEPIRGKRELLFPWPHTEQTLYRDFHRLQERAGMAPAERFGLHDIRRSAARVLWQTDPEAARLALGHTSLDVTANYYVAHEQIAKPAL